MKTKENNLETKDFFKTVGFISLGCDKNRVDTEKIITNLQQYSFFKMVQDRNEAQIIIVNTCAFLKWARDEAKRIIKQMGELKVKGKLEKLIVVGCLPMLEHEKVLKSLPCVDKIVEPKDYNKIDEIIFDLYKIEKLKPDIEIKFRTTTTPSHYAYIKIADGCNNKCAFCKIPEIRGNYKSVPKAEIIEEATRLCDRGVKEIVLLAQDITRYGCDIGSNLVELLQELAKIKKLSWIRLLYCYPEKVDDKLIAEIKNNPKIVKYIELPLQHASDKMLKLMNRRGDKKYLIKLIKKLRKKIPNIKIRSEFMVGFPGETEKEYKELCKFLRKFKLDSVGFFKYSREPNTPSYDFENQVDEKIKDFRLENIKLLQSNIEDKINSKMKGKVFKVLCDSFDSKNKFYVGRPYFCAPDIDYEVLIIANKKISIGSFVDVKILDYDKGYFVGEVVTHEFTE